MSKSDTFEILLDYPKEHGINYETHESRERFYLNPNDPFLRMKYVVFKTDGLFFCAYDSYAAKAYTTTTYSGLYGSINLPAGFECKIYKKDILDFFFRMNRKKSGEKTIDDKLTITTRSKSFPKGLLSLKDVMLFLRINSIVTPVELLIQNNYRPIIRELNDRKIIGLETNQWICKKEDLEVFINSGGELIRNILKASG